MTRTAGLSHEELKKKKKNGKQPGLLVDVLDRDSPRERNEMKGVYERDHRPRIWHFVPGFWNRVDGCHPLDFGAVSYAENCAVVMLPVAPTYSFANTRSAWWPPGELLRGHIVACIMIQRVFSHVSRPIRNLIYTSFTPEVIKSTSFGPRYCRTAGKAWRGPSVHQDTPSRKVRD
jgi:hypothetical protein